MQTKYISYSSNLNINNSYKLLANLQIDKIAGLTKEDIFAGIDSVKLSAYTSNSSNLSNKGMLGKVRWFKDDVDFSVCGEELSTLPSYADYRAGKKTKGSDKSEHDSWVTLQTIQAQLNASALDALIAEYDKDRKANEAREVKKAKKAGIEYVKTEVVCIDNKLVNVPVDM